MCVGVLIQLGRAPWSSDWLSSVSSDLEIVVYVMYTHEVAVLGILCVEHITYMYMSVHVHSLCSARLPSSSSNHCQQSMR